MVHKIYPKGAPVALLNMSYLTDSYIVFTLQMESSSKNTIFGLKMMVKSGLKNPSIQEDTYLYY